MIFVTVGTHHQPFGRLLAALAALDARELMVQHGSAPPPAGVERAEPYMSFGRMLEGFHDADVVITHAGVGSILCAMREGHVPLVVPRYRHLGEHVDDHQVELTRALEARGSVIPVWDTDELAALVAGVPPRGPRLGHKPTPSSLSRSVRSALWEPKGVQDSEE